MPISVRRNPGDQRELSRCAKPSQGTLDAIISMSVIRLLLMIGVMLLTFACQTPASRYPLDPSDDSLGKGNTPKIPTEFKTGNASLEQAKAWSKTVLEDSYFGNGLIQTEQHNLLPNGRPALFISDQSCAGTGGNEYMVFDQTPRGLRYLGDISFALCSALPPDLSNQPRLVTYWHLSANDGTLTLWRLADDGFTEIRSIQIHDDGTDQGNRIFDSFFGSKPATSALIDATFGLK